MFKFKRTLVVTGTIVAAGLLIGTAAYAIVRADRGPSLSVSTSCTARMRSPRHRATFTNVTGAVRWVNIPAGTERMLDARYTAESACIGAGGWCSVRIVVISPAGGVVTELDPASGADFAFDSAAGGDNWEGSRHRAHLAVPVGRNVPGAGSDAGRRRGEGTSGRLDPGR